MGTTVAKGTRIRLQFDDKTTLEYLPTPGLELAYVLMQIEQYARINEPDSIGQQGRKSPVPPPPAPSITR